VNAIASRFADDKPVVQGRTVHGVARLAALTALACAVVSVSAQHAVATRPNDVDARKPPRAWDERVAELADFVERERGLDFKHPVPVRFLTDARFRRELATDDADLTREEREELEEAGAFLRALGLIQLDAKTLFEKSSELDAGAVLAFYDFDEKEVVVRGTQLDIATRVTVVHELTHVLQDQYFDLTKLEDEAGSAVGAVDALVEGDAIRLEDEYVSTLSQADQDAYGQALDQQAAEFEGAFRRDVPAVLQILSGAPYSLGPTLVEAIAVDRGEKAIDTAFRNPPTSDKQILTPSAYLTGDKPRRVDVPRLTTGEKRVGKPDTIGALALYLMLSARVDPEVALTTVDSWAGDSFVQFQRGNMACIRAAFVGPDPANTERIAAALDQWVALGRRDTATADRVNGTATLTACDPGRAPADTKITAAGYVLDVRVSAFSVEFERGATVARAACVAERAPFDTELRGFLLQAEEQTAEQIAAFATKVAGVEALCAG
jgi:hypothetical protein